MSYSELQNMGQSTPEESKEIEEMFNKIDNKLNLLLVQIQEFKRLAGE